MGKAIEIKARIDSITRVDGKAEAKMVVVIPITVSADMPTGKVFMTIEPQQSGLPLGGPAAKPVRGNKG